MILNKFIRFISRGKSRYISCTHYQFCAFRKYLAHFATPLIAQDTTSLRTKETLVDAPNKAVEKA